MRSYLDPKLTPAQRIEFAFYAVFLQQAWFTDLERVKKATHMRNEEAVYKLHSERNISVKAARCILKDTLVKGVIIYNQPAPF